MKRLLHVLTFVLINPDLFMF